MSIINVSKDIDFFTGQKRKRVTKRPKLELYPIAKVQEFVHGKIGPSAYWVVVFPDGTEVQCKSYAAAEKVQQENRPTASSKNASLDKKEKV